MLQLHADVLRWQSEQGSDRLPSANEEKSLADRIARYMTEEKEKCVRLMRQAYPPDVEAVRLLDLDCLEDSDDMHVGMKWRSEAERALLHSIPGWKEGGPILAVLLQRVCLSVPCVNFLKTWTLLWKHMFVGCVISMTLIGTVSRIT